ncbi:MAG: Flagellar basal-body rod modification protein FlgD [Alphaproteobacteria bacterium]|nr:Flagellar basal-body rod modification protein FlgD [Alphaproteobacteria bacterium]
MLDAISLSLGGVAGSGKTTENSRNSLQDTYSQFLALLTTQLKNQDPLNPMDSKDFTNQLISLSSAEQQLAQTDKLNSILEVSQSSAVNMALNYIGKEVDYVGGQAQFNGSPVNVKYYLDADATQTKVSVLDKDNNVVWSSNGDVKAGGHSITWDGKDKDGNIMANGDYTVSVGAKDKDDKAVKTTVIVPSTVSGIETADGQVMLVIGNQKVAIGSVQAVRQPTATTSTAS